jgi:hypothetical protein
MTQLEKLLPHYFHIVGGLREEQKMFNVKKSWKTGLTAIQNGSKQVYKSTANTFTNLHNKISTKIQNYREFKEYLEEANSMAYELAAEIQKHNSRLELQDQLKNLKKHTILMELVLKEMEQQDEN